MSNSPVLPINKNDLTKIIRDSKTTVEGHIFNIRSDDKISVGREIDKLLRKGLTSIIFLSHKKT